MSGFFCLRNDKSLIFDFFAFLGASQKFQNYNDLLADKLFDINEVISNAYYNLFIENKRINSGVSMFFAESKAREMNLFEWMFIGKAYEFNSCEDLINEIEKNEPMSFAYKALRFHDPLNNFSDVFYKEIVSSPTLFMNYMSGLNTTTEVRWDIMSFVQHPEDVVEELKNYISKIFIIFKNEYDKLAMQLEDLNNHIINGINDMKIEELVSDYELTEKQKVLKNQIKSNVISPLNKEKKLVGVLFAPNRINKIITEDGEYYTIGIGAFDSYKAYLENVTSEQKLGDIFKAFTDSTRTQIIEALREKECYNGELSRMLDVPMSSLTHHMEILNECDFVIKRNVGKRTYYKLNKNQFLNASALLRKYIEGYDL